jgi:hypothetical protein
MSKKVNRVRVELDPMGIKNLPAKEIKQILRGADDLITSGGRSLLAKILKGSRDKKVLELGLDKSPVYGYYRQLSLEEITARIDWVLIHGYLDIQYDGRLPFLIYTEKGWEIERETYAKELLQGFDEMLVSGKQEFDMSYLKDRNRDMILILLDLVEASGKKEYLPILFAWEKVDYKKVRQRIQEVIRHLSSPSLASTAAWTAAVRALETQRPDRLFADPWANALAGETGSAWIRGKSADSVVPIVLRTRYFDDYLKRINEQENIRQIVLLGAGLDTRAFRLDWQPGT